MSDKVYVDLSAPAPLSQIGATMDALTSTIHARREAGDESYTHRLLAGDLDKLLKKLNEEALETALAAKDASALGAKAGEVDHLRYEAADVVYHLLVLLERFDISVVEFAAELNTRMKADEMPTGGVRLKPEYVNRGHHEEK